MACVEAAVEGADPVQGSRSFAVVLELMLDERPINLVTGIIFALRLRLSLGISRSLSLGFGSSLRR